MKTQPIFFKLETVLNKWFVKQLQHESPYTPIFVILPIVELFGLSKQEWSQSGHADRGF